MREERAIWRYQTFLNHETERGPTRYSYNKTEMTVDAIAETYTDLTD